MKKLTLMAGCLALIFVALADNGKQQPDWTVVYGSLNGPEGRAVELLTADLGDLLLRQPGVYATYVLPCRPAESFGSVTGNVFLVGTASNAVLAAYLQPGDVPAGGYLVRVVPEATRDVVLLAGDTPAAVIWAVSDFCSDGLEQLKLAHNSGNGIYYTRAIFADFVNFRSQKRLARYESRRSPQTRVRSVFTWAHPIDDYCDYFRNLARLKMTRVYLWNDFAPLNAREVVDYAHSWGIEVFWGFPWGWDTGNKIGDRARADVDETSARILADWRANWRDLPGDGIYFQTFTETKNRKTGEETIAARAVRLVNKTAAAMFAEKPDLKIVFGLHATSVRSELPTLAQTDPRLEILWEDMGAFPYSVEIHTQSADDAAFVQTIATDAVHSVGLVWKCQLMQDWMNWNHQVGPYFLGVASHRTYAADVRLQEDLWKNYRRTWLDNAPTAYAAAQQAHAIGPQVELNLAAQLNGPIRFPTALLAELFYSSAEPLETILARVRNRTREFVE